MLPSPINIWTVRIVEKLNDGHHALSIESLQNRTLVRRSTRITRNRKLGEHPFHPLERLDLGGNICNLALRLFLHINTLSSWIHPQSEQFFNFIERHSKLLRPLDELDSRDVVLVVLPVAGLSSRRLGNKPAPLVISNCVDIDLCFSGALADR